MAKLASAMKGVPTVQEIEYLREEEVDIDEGEEDDMEDFGPDFSDGDDDSGSGEAGSSGAASCLCRGTGLSCAVGVMLLLCK